MNDKMNYGSNRNLNHRLKPVGNRGLYGELKHELNHGSNHGLNDQYQLNQEVDHGCNPPSLLEIHDLIVTFRTKSGNLPVLEQISLSIQRGEILGLVGESGCGKSMASLAVMGLLPGHARVTGGSMELDGRQMIGMGEEERRRLRGKEMSMIFQDPMTSLNPVFTIGEQLVETIRLHLKLNRAAAREHAAAMLRKVGLARPEALLGEYPHQLSGGMRQRVMIAMALACRPKLLIADEPTTALDVTIQAQILGLLRKINREEGTAILLISHDLGVIGSMCDRVAVMYAGQIVESAPTAELFRSPQHPYTIGLMASRPLPEHKGQPLYSIGGRVPGLEERSALTGCPLANRCALASRDARCGSQRPAAVETAGGHLVRCWQPQQAGLQPAAAVPRTSEEVPAHAAAAVTA